MYVKMKRSPRDIEITSEPPGASIFINGEGLLGKTPLTCRVPPTAPLKLRAEKPGHRTYYETYNRKTGGWQCGAIVCAELVSVVTVLAALYDVVNIENFDGWYVYPSSIHVTLVPENNGGALNELFRSGRISEEEHEALGLE